MKYIKLLIFLTSFLILSATIASGVDVPLETLRRMKERIEKDGETIKELRTTILQKDAEIQRMQQDYQIIYDSNERQKGIYLGVGMGYPLNGGAIILYKFEKWGVYGQVGYSQKIYANMGLIIKMK